MPPSDSSETGIKGARSWKTRARTLARRIIYAALVSSALAAVFLFLADLRITSVSGGAIHENPARTPRTDIALVLGTSKYVSPGRPNAYYSARIKAAADIFREGGVRGMVVSGDNATLQYNEPQRMRLDLAENGVPEKYITSDYAGFRTLDSIVRMKEVFGHDRYTIVSQRFHLERALYIARALGHDPVGFAAETPPGEPGFRARVRELLARGLAVLDVNVLNRAPKFLGPRVVPVLFDR